MAYRWKPKYAPVDPDNPKAWSTADCCGFLWPLHMLQWQYSYLGTTTPQNTRMLVCPNHIDPLNVQDAAYILPPDPLPVFNARPEPYTLDESSWLSTQDGDTLTTQSGVPITTAIPNPSAIAATAHLNTLIVSPGGSVAVAYLDIFNGNPLGGGVSVLGAITGSATRTNIASSLATVSGVAVNPDTIIVALESSATVNTNYVGIYSAASGGTLLMSGPAWVSGQSVTEGNPVVFDALGLNINLN